MGHPYNSMVHIFLQINHSILLSLQHFNHHLKESASRENSSMHSGHSVGGGGSGQEKERPTPPPLCSPLLVAFWRQEDVEIIWVFMHIQEHGTGIPLVLADTPDVWSGEVPFMDLLAALLGSDVPHTYWLQLEEEPQPGTVPAKAMNTEPH